MVRTGLGIPGIDRSEPQLREGGAREASIMVGIDVALVRCVAKGSSWRKSPQIPSPSPLDALDLDAHLVSFRKDGLGERHRSRPQSDARKRGPACSGTLPRCRRGGGPI